MQVECIFSETYFGKEVGGKPIKFTLHVTSPVPSANGGFACSIVGCTEIASQVFNETPLTVTGLTARRALGEALILSDSILEFRDVSQGPWALSIQGEPYNLYRHGAVPREMLAMQLKARDESRLHLQSVQ